MVTMKDVAREAGVSLGTVSNVLNNRPFVTEENRNRTWEAIAKLGYRKNTIASQMRSNRSHTVGLIIPDIANPFYADIARGVGDEMHSGDYTVFLCNTDRDARTEQEMIETLRSKGVDGIIIYKPRIAGSVLDEINKETCILLLDADPGKTLCPVINVDDRQGVTEVVSHLLSFGHRHIAMMYAYDGSVSSKVRKDSFLAALKKGGIRERDFCMIEGDYSIQSGMDCFARLMEREEPPTAIFATNDMMALGAIYQSTRLGIRIPEDVSLIGYDDIREAKWITPALTTVWHPKYELGTAAARKMKQLIQSRMEETLNETDKSELMAPRLMVRGSVGHVRRKAV